MCKPQGGLAALFAFLVLFGFLETGTGCGGGTGSSGSNSPMTVFVGPSGQSLTVGTSINLTAYINGGTSQSAVTWTITGPGQLSNAAQNSITYTAPFSVAVNTNVVVSAAIGSGESGYIPLTILPLNAIPNIQPVVIDGGPSSTIYPNGGFTSVTVCSPGTTDCRTVDGILVDTASVGLRILSSALPALPSLKNSNGVPTSECFQFVDHSYLWGRVVKADVKINGEVARQISIHSIADPVGFEVPADCSNSSAGKDDDTQQALGANGILGIGLEPNDCGAKCDPSAGGTPPSPAYYACGSGGCSPTFVPLIQQVDHPVPFFAVDNNGVILQLPPLQGAATSVIGSVTFGIGTQMNNALGTATVFTLDGNDNFTTQLVGTGQKLTSSFIDSGSSGFFFPDGDIPTCSSSSFYCPLAPTSLTAISTGNNGAQSTITFSVDNADNLFAQNPADGAFSALAGTNGAGECKSGSGACSFDWGMPFFFGRTVFVAINGQTLPVGTPAAPWWAYAVGFGQP